MDFVIAHAVAFLSWTPGALTNVAASLSFNQMVDQSSTHLDGLFRALADPTRRAMVHALSGGQRSVSELAQPFAMSLAAASKHVKVLEQAGLIRRSIHGRTHLCALDPAPLAEGRTWLSTYERFWSERLDALDALFPHETESEADADHRG